MTSIQLLTGSIGSPPWALAENQCKYTYSDRCAPVASGTKSRKGMNGRAEGETKSFQANKKRKKRE